THIERCHARGQTPDVSERRRAGPDDRLDARCDRSSRRSARRFEASGGSPRARPARDLRPHSAHGYSLAQVRDPLRPRASGLAGSDAWPVRSGRRRRRSLVGARSRARLAAAEAGREKALSDASLPGLAPHGWRVDGSAAVHGRCDRRPSGATTEPGEGAGRRAGHLKEPSTSCEGPPERRPLARRQPLPARRRLVVYPAAAAPVLPTRGSRWVARISAPASPSASPSPATRPIAQSPQSKPLARTRTVG